MNNLKKKRIKDRTKKLVKKKINKCKGIKKKLTEMLRFLKSRQKHNKDIIKIAMYRKIRKKKRFVKILVTDIAIHLNEINKCYICMKPDKKIR